MHPYSRHDDHQRGHSSAVSSVLFSTGNHALSETRGGAYIYNGDAATYHDWEFRTRMRMHKSSDPYKYSEAMSRVIDGLRGEAFTAAKQVGLENLRQCGSVLQQASQRTEAAETASQHSAGSGGRPID